MIKHIVTWKLKAEDVSTKATSTAAIKAALEPLAEVIDGKKSSKSKRTNNFFPVCGSTKSRTEHPARKPRAASCGGMDLRIFRSTCRCANLSSTFELSINRKRPLFGFTCQRWR